MINFLGKQLATKLNMKVMPSKGIIRLGIKDDHGTTTEINFEKFKYTLSNGLKKRLQNLKVENVNEICNSLIQQLIDNQSILNLGNF